MNQVEYDIIIQALSAEIARAEALIAEARSDEVSLMQWQGHVARLSNIVDGIKIMSGETGEREKAKEDGGA